jgi:hypothetical protein
MKKSTEVKAKFSIHDEPPYFEGKHDPTDHWNGWACPTFDWKNAVKVAQWMNRMNKKYGQSNETAVILEEQRTIILVSYDASYDGNECGTQVFKGPTYAIGAGSWCWTAKEKGD